jgi:hypothetical protein
MPVKTERDDIRFMTNGKTSHKSTMVPLERELIGKDSRGFFVSWHEILGARWVIG